MGRSSRLHQSQSPLLSESHASLHLVSSIDVEAFMDDWLGQLLSTGCGPTAALAALACASLHKSLPDFLEPGQHLGVQAVVADKAI